MKNKYKLLESKMVRFQDLIKVRTFDNNEPLVEIDFNSIQYGYLPKMSDMKLFLRNKILIRKKAYEKLKSAQKILKKIMPSYSLYVTYGYRSKEIQTKRFLKILSKNRFFFNNPLDLYEEIHRFVAVPTVAGHPTGGAIDITIINNNTDLFLDFGTIQYDYKTKNCYVFSPFISETAKKNRLLLRNILLMVGFAPFDGEWWHFSYGDREWAYYYKKTKTRYDMIQI